MGNNSSSEWSGLEKPISANKRSVSTIGKVTSFKSQTLDIKRTTSLRSNPIQIGTGSESGRRDDDYAATFLHHLRQFRERQVMTDVTFKLGTTTITCHKVVLGALSPILLEIFSKKKHSMSGIAESVPADTLAALVEFVYNSEAQLCPESLTKLRDATSKLGITQLSKMFEKLLAKLDERGGNGTITYAYRSRTIPGLLSGLRHLRESAIFTDITLRSGETDFPAHRVVLAAASPQLQSMIDDLDDCSPLKVLNIPNMSASSLKVILRYMYGGELQVDRSVVIDLLLSGIYLGLTFVAQSAGRFIEESCISLSQFVNEQNWFHLFSVSKKHSLSRLKSEIRRFVGANLTPVSDQISFKELSFEDVAWLIPMSTSRNEMALFEALTGWLRYSVGNRQKYLSSTMALIKFRKMSPRELLKVQNNEFILANPEMKAKIIAASRRNSNGKETSVRSAIICVGGEGKDGLQPNVFYFDSKQWLKLTSLPVRRKNFGICVHDDYVYIAGGVSIEGATLNSFCRYSVKENKWESLASMSKRRSSFSLLYLNGYLNAIGGYYDGTNMTNTTEMFDVRRQKWKKGSVLPHPRAAYGAMVLRRTGEIMLTGGIGDETGVLLLSGDMWIKRNSLPQRVTPSHTLTQCHNSIYLIDTKSPTLLQYHSSVDEWTLLKPPPQLSYALSVTIKNTIYLVGSRQTQSSVALMTQIERPNHPDANWTAPEPVSDLPFADFQLAVINYTSN